MRFFTKFFIAITILSYSYKFESTQGQKYQEKVDLYCDFSLDEFKIDTETRINKRDKSKTPIAIQIKTFVRSIKDGDYGALLSSVVILLVISILMFLVSLISIGLFFVACICRKGGKASMAKMYFLISAIGVFFYICIFITMVVFAAQMDSQFDSTNCALSKIPNDLLNGVDGDISFIGLFRFYDMLTSLETEIGQIKNVQSSIEEIKNLNLGQASSQADSSIISFSNTYKNKNSIDGEGQNTPSIVTSQMTDRINEFIEFEFDKYVQVAEQLSEGAQAAGDFLQDGQVENATIIIQEAKQKVDQFMGPIESSLGNVLVVQENFSTYLPYAYISLAIIGGIILVFYLFYMYLLKKRIYNNYKNRKIGYFRICLVLLGFITFIFSLVSLFLMLSSLLVSSFCDFNKELLTSTDTKVFFAELGVNLSTEMEQLVNECLPEDASGNLLNIIEIPNFDNLNNLVSGFSSFENFKQNITDAPEDSISLSKTWETYQGFADGLYYTHENVAVSLAALNEQVDCADIEYVMNKQNCTTTTQCVAIADTSTYQPPSCASDTTTVIQLTTKLRGSYESNNAMFNDMVSNLQQKPNEDYKVIRSKLQQASGAVDNVKNQITNTLDTLSKFQSGFGDLLDCRVLRKVLLDIEVGMCFGTQKTLFLLYLFVALVTMNMMCINICLCCVSSKQNNKTMDLRVDQDEEAKNAK